MDMNIFCVQYKWDASNIGCGSFESNEMAYKIIESNEINDRTF